MPNLNAPSGLSPVMYRDGSNWTGQARLYRIAASNTNSFYIGDPVAIDSTNFSSTTDGINYVTQATAGSACRGVIVGIGSSITNFIFQGGPLINPNNLTLNYRPSGAQATDSLVAVVDDPYVIYEIMEDTTSTPGTNVQMTKNANFKFNAVATGVYVSGVTLNSNTYATTSTLSLKIIQPSQRTDNTPFQAYQRLLVTINNHDFNTGTAGY